MKTVSKLFVLAFSLLVFNLTAAQASSTMGLTISLDPVAPRITDNSVGVALSINKDLVNVSAMQFDITIPQSLLNNDLELTHFNQDGSINTTNISMMKNVINYGNGTATYRFVITAQNNDMTKFIHVKNAAAVTNYKVLRIKFKKAGALTFFHVSDQIKFKIENVIATTVDGTKLMVNYPAPEITYIFKPTGDINGDGVVDILDVMKQVNHILEINSLIGKEFEEGDLNRDGRIDITDVSLEIEVINGIVIPMMPGSSFARLVMRKVEPFGNTFAIKGALLACFTANNPNTFDFVDLSVGTVSYGKEKLSMLIEFNTPTNTEVTLVKNASCFTIGYEAGVSEVNEELLNQQTCWPNPASETINFNNPLGEAKLIITDERGSQVFNQIIYQSIFTFEKQLPAGNYFYQLVGNQRTILGKFIIVK